MPLDTEWEPWAEQTRAQQTPSAEQTWGEDTEWEKEVKLTRLKLTRGWEPPRPVQAGPERLWAAALHLASLEPTEQGRAKLSAPTDGKRKKTNKQKNTTQNQTPRVPRSCGQRLHETRRPLCFPPPAPRAFINTYHFIKVTVLHMLAKLPKNVQCARPRPLRHVS